jgi:hypothetical protein
MDARSTHMATHHVSLRRACPAPVGQLTASPGERGSKNTSGSSAAPLVQNTLMLLPTGTIDRRTAKQHSSIGEVQMSYRAFLHRRAETEREMVLLAKAAIRLTTGAKSPVACGGLKPSYGHKDREPPATQQGCAHCQIRSSMRPRTAVTGHQVSEPPPVQSQSRATLAGGR